MKQGNQFYYDIQIFDSNGTILTNESVEKIVFNIKDTDETTSIKKEYTPTSTDVIYDGENQCFKVWMTEEETLNLEDTVELDARVLFDSGEILGSLIKTDYFNPVLVKESILDTEEEVENNA